MVEKMEDDVKDEPPPRPRRRGMSLLNIHIPTPGSGITSAFTNWTPLTPMTPSFSVTPATPNTNSARKFSFASLRKLSTSASSWVSVNVGLSVNSLTTHKVFLSGL